MWLISHKCVTGDGCLDIILNKHRLSEELDLTNAGEYVLAVLSDSNIVPLKIIHFRSVRLPLKTQLCSSMLSLKISLCRSSVIQVNVVIIDGAEALALLFCSLISFVKS